MNRLKNFPYILAFVVVVLPAASGRCQQLQTLYSFRQPPANPAGGVVQGPDGNYYGAAQEGGEFGYGAVYRVETNGTFTDLVDFNTVNGSYPFGGLLSDNNGNFYGTTQNGGTNGYGTVFRVTTSGALTTLADFYPAIGANPQGTLIWGNDGMLYGTTLNGGTNNKGTVFQITTNGVLNSFFSFSGNNGANPVAGLFLARDGNFYGTTQNGGIGLGTVFQLTPGGVLTDLGSFDYLYNGAFPASSLVEDAAGNLYGTAANGGGGGTGAGTLFEIPVTNNQVIIGLTNFGGMLGASPSSGMVAGPGNVFYGATQGTIYQFTPTNAMVKVLATFSGTNGSVASGTPVLDATGNLFGTAYHGGAQGYGTVYELATNGSLTAVYSFAASPGAQPLGGLVQDTNGTLYGTTYTGGAADNGTVFSLGTNGVYNVLVTFRSTNGGYPCNGLLLGNNGVLFGTSRLGGGNGSADGTVFSVTTNGQTFSTLATFNSDNGAFPTGSLVDDTNGNFYGTTVNGGTNNDGTVFRLDTNRVVTTLVTFNYTNGAFPGSTLALDNAGNLWGTTSGGGPGLGAGTIFTVPTTGVPTNTVFAPLTSFNGANGSIPAAGLTPGPDGAYYGATEAGGAHNKGVVYRVTTNGIITTLFSFNGGNGAYPVAPLIPGSNGVFYGTTSGFFDNQTNGFGTVFRITTNGVLNTFLAFNGTNGSAPSAPLLLGKDGALYGTTQYGGPEGSGTIFKLTLGPINPIPLNIQGGGRFPVVTWTNPVFNLQAASNVTSTFTNLPEAFSPYTNTFTNPTMFFRLSVQTN
jgi:uncharacterized repeat protein (TIGR03803 family)